jgi:hypothetical protein
MNNYLIPPNKLTYILNYNNIEYDMEDSELLFIKSSKNKFYINYPEGSGRLQSLYKRLLTCTRDI